MHDLSYYAMLDQALADACYQPEQKMKRAGYKDYEEKIDKLKKVNGTSSDDENSQDESKGAKRNK